MLGIIELGLLSLLAFGQIAPPRRDSIPIPAAVQSARAAGTRDVNGAPGARYWQLRPTYTLKARLVPRSALLLGTGTLSFTNTSPAPLDQIVLRLDQNRFRAGRNTPVRTRGLTLRALEIDGQPIRLNGSSATGLRTTVARVRLPRSLPPGASLTVRMRWEYEVPSADERMALRQGRLGTEVFQIAQWYPRLAMFDDLSGWDLEPHNGSQEFFNHFSRFDVAIQVPAGWIVGATGSLQNPQELLGATALRRLRAAEETDTTLFVIGPKGGERDVLSRTAQEPVWRFVADSVSDFAWGASSRFRWAVSSLRLPSGRLMVHALLTPARADSSLAISANAARLLSSLSQSIRPYPWSVHTLVDGPEGAMEYPMLTMSHGNGLAHELAHQWFPMQVGTDETRFDFLDEGFAGFYADVVGGRSVGRPDPQPALAAPLMVASDVQRARPGFGYGRGRRMLHALASRFGEAKLLVALQQYVDDWRFKHPSPWDFMASMEHSFGQRLDDLWIPWLYSTQAIP